MNVYIWGTGIYASTYLNTNEIKSEDIVGFVESKRSRDFFRGKKIFEPYEVAENNDYDYILVLAAGNANKKIYDTCVSVHIDTSRLILFDNLNWTYHCNGMSPLWKCFKEIHKNSADIRTQFPILYRWQSGIYTVTPRSLFDIADTYSLMKTIPFHSNEYRSDYLRFRTFELIADELINQKVEGNVAELGVYKGAFSAIINAKFPSKKLYLFDTFESFDPQEFQEEVDAGKCSPAFIEDFKDTSAETVINHMPHKEQCIIRKGLFPNTAAGMENETYAFVSIDVDLEKSMLEGLRHFYPRLSAGGVIFVHDYNSCLRGIKSAVNSYENELEKPLCKVPLADQCGTLIIMKP